MYLVAFSLLFLGVAYGHMSIFLPSMWGFQQGNINDDWPVQPLQNLNFVDWWMHGPKSINDPPPANAITQLPAGGTIDFEIGGSKEVTSYGRGLWHPPGKSARTPPSNPWYQEWYLANIHSDRRGDVAGCSLGIVYKSRIEDVKPTDFVIMSVVKDCIARSLQAFDIPFLPACPNGLCICSWFWIHNSSGGTDQMYMTPFQCNVSNPSKRVIGIPVPPVRCDGQPSCRLFPNWGNRTTVCRKPLAPMYWAQNEGNNMANPTNAQCAPIYSKEYGYPDGAQHQIFVDDFQCMQNAGDTLKSSSNTDSLPSSISSNGSPLITPACATKLTVQGDGNLVLADVNGQTYWSSGTAGKGNGPFKLTVQDDGDLVLSDSFSATWSTGTSGHGACAPYSLKLRDANPVTLTLTDCNGDSLWSTN